MSSLLEIDKERLAAEIKKQIDRLGRYASRSKDKVRAALSQAGAMVAGQAKRNLQVNRSVVTGRLITSITWRMVNVTEVRIGTAVAYARALEFGFRGFQNVRPYWRNVTMAWGRPITPRLAVVHQHRRFVNRRGKPYLVPALRQHEPKIREMLRAALKENG